MNISHAISISLRRLNLRYVDALLMHLPYEESPNSFVEQWVQMEAAVEAGKARALGLAGVGVDPACPDPGMCWLWWSRSNLLVALGIGAPSPICPYGLLSCTPMETAENFPSAASARNSGECWGDAVNCREIEKMGQGNFFFGK